MAITLVSVLAAVMVVAVAFGGRQPAGPPFDSGHRRTIGFGQVAFDFAGPERWAARYRREHARAVRLERQLRRQRSTLSARLERLSPQAAIRLVFGDRADEALRVAACETGHTFSTRAENGQYLGLFQMGSSERASYGHGSSPLEQTLAAYVYFVTSGRDWSPWSCKP